MDTGVFLSLMLLGKNMDADIRSCGTDAIITLIVQQEESQNNNFTSEDMWKRGRDHIIVVIKGRTAKGSLDSI